MKSTNNDKQQNKFEECKQCLDFVETTDGKYCRQCGKFLESKIISETNQFLCNRQNVHFFASRNYDNTKQVLTNQFDYQQIREQKIISILQQFLDFQKLSSDHAIEIKSLCLKFLESIPHKAKTKLICAVIFINFLKKQQINVCLQNFLTAFDISGHQYLKYLQILHQHPTLNIAQYKSSNCLQIKPVLEQFSSKLASLFMKKDTQWQLKEQKENELKKQNNLKLQISMNLKEKFTELMQIQQIDLFFNSTLQYQGIQSLFIYISEKLYKIKFKNKDLMELISQISLKTLNKQLKGIEKIVQENRREDQQQLMIENSFLGQSKSSEETQDENMDFSQINFDKQPQEEQEE